MSVRAALGAFSRTAKQRPLFFNESLALSCTRGRQLQSVGRFYATGEWVKPETLEEHPNTEHEHGKMVSEGGGSTASYAEAKESVKNKSSGGIVENVKEQAEKEMNTARDMVKDIPQKASETKEELKETAAVAGHALKRDVEKVAEKVGIRESKPGNLENE